jgi:hypothetical protein
MGVDAGGDAFELARELNEALEGSLTIPPRNEPVTVTAHGFVERAAEQAARYEARIAEQAKLLGTQGKRIVGAKAALEDNGPEFSDRITKALQFLYGEWDGSD